MASVSFPLPQTFENWFTCQGWQPRPHQLELYALANQKQSALLIAPTGAGKTLAGFLPSLVDLYTSQANARKGPHTLYISPLKALAVDIARNLDKPIADMKLPIRVETRTGDTPAHKRKRQKTAPPDILMTTPEQLALLLSHSDSAQFFGCLKRIVFDELHALVTSKRGDLLALGLARLRTLAPDVVTTGLSATVADEPALAKWLVAQDGTDDAIAQIVKVQGGAKPNISILETNARIPWAGHSSQYAMDKLYEAIKAHQTTLIFVNTRSQSEMIFQALWTMNEDNLPIALHHGSLDKGQRRRVEAAMSAGQLRAIVATSTLDLGIDWGDVDLVVHVGAPKGASRLAQRIGRSNHRMDEPSKAILIPANRFEVMECQAALDANYVGAQDTPPIRNGALDVLAQHIMGMACTDAFDTRALYSEIITAYPYREMDFESFERVLEFVSTGGYALKTYERFARIRKRKDGKWRVSNPRTAQQYRLNVGTIVEAPMLKVRMTSRKGGRLGRGGRVLGELEEGFLDTLTPGDTFLFGGEIVRFETIDEQQALVTHSTSTEPKIPYYAGGRFPLTTYLADTVRAMLGDPSSWHKLPEQVREWLELQKDKSILPTRETLLVETFPRGGRYYMVAYPFEGRLAHQTLGMLLTRRLERARAKPLGFVATDYAIGIWGLGDYGETFVSGKPSLADLFDEDMLGDDLEEWVFDSFLLKRTFRNVAQIAGLIERRFPGQEKTGRQMTLSSDLIYDVLRRYEPDHILMQATWADASEGLLDIGRVSEMLARIKNHIVHQKLDRISPLSVPVMLEVGKEPIFGEARESVLEEAEDIIAEAMG
jgi:ATP-dependent Lhr-like helicase